MEEWYFLFVIGSGYNRGKKPTPPMHALSHTDMYCTKASYYKFKEIWVKSTHNFRLDTDLAIRASNYSIMFFLGSLKSKIIILFEKTTSQK